VDHFEYAVNKMGGIIEILTSSKQKETNQNSQEESFSYLKYYYESVQWMTTQNSGSLSSTASQITMNIH
jgi:hypothetical protein